MGVNLNVLEQQDTWYLVYMCVAWAAAKSTSIDNDQFQQFVGWVRQLGARISSRASPPVFDGPLPPRNNEERDSLLQNKQHVLYSFNFVTEMSRFKANSTPIVTKNHQIQH